MLELVKQDTRNRDAQNRSKLPHPRRGQKTTQARSKNKCLRLQTSNMKDNWQRRCMAVGTDVLTTANCSRGADPSVHRNSELFWDSGGRADDGDGGWGADRTTVGGQVANQAEEGERGKKNGRDKVEIPRTSLAEVEIHDMRPTLPYKGLVLWNDYASLTTSCQGEWRSLSYSASLTQNVIPTFYQRKCLRNYLQISE